jgi:hypothetical protein
MTYFPHLILNLKIAARSIRMGMYLMAVMHALHALIPLECTSHHAIGLAGKGEEGPKTLIELLRSKL